MNAMKKISDQEFADFLMNRPLYHKLKVIEGLTRYELLAFLNPYSFKDKPFRYLCPHEDEIHTFRTRIKDCDQLNLSSIVDTDDPDKLPYYFDQETRKLDFRIHVEGICQSCKRNIDFLIRTTSDNTWEERVHGLDVFIQKVGQFPSYEVGLNSNLKKYLSTEDNSNYKKALACLSISFGIGSYAYLRRIIQNEIVKIIKDISELDFDGADQVSIAYQKYLKDSQMSKLIDILNKHVPQSFNELGDNPIKLLYAQLSGGIHEFSDDECMEKAINIDILINYVVKKLYDEKFHLKEVRTALKNLNKNNS